MKGQREPKLFTASFKRRQVMQTDVVLTAIKVLLPLGTAIAVGRVHAGLPVAAGAAVGAALVTFVICFWLEGTLRVAGQSALQMRLRNKLAGEFMPPGTWAGVCVGYSPVSTPRLFEGSWFWDLGFLCIVDDYIAYLGDRASFALRRSHVSAVRVSDDLPGWRRAPLISVRWSDGQAGRKGTFYVQPADVKSAWQIPSAARSLGSRLQGWRQQSLSGLSLPEELNQLRAPGVSIEKGDSPRKRMTAIHAAVIAVIGAAASVGIGFVLRLPLSPLEVGNVSVAAATTFLLCLLELKPYAGYFEVEPELVRAFTPTLPQPQAAGASPSIAGGSARPSAIPSFPIADRPGEPSMGLADRATLSPEPVGAAKKTASNGQSAEVEEEELDWRLANYQTPTYKQPRESRSGGRKTWLLVAVWLVIVYIGLRIYAPNSIPALPFPKIFPSISTTAQSHRGEQTAAPEVAVTPPLTPTPELSRIPPAGGPLLPESSRAPEQAASSADDGGVQVIIHPPRRLRSRYRASRYSSSSAPTYRSRSNEAAARIAADGGYSQNAPSGVESAQGPAETTDTAGASFSPDAGSGSGIPVRHHHAFGRSCTGELEISADGVNFHSDDSNDSFEAPASSISDFAASAQGGLEISFRVGRHKYNFTGGESAARAYISAGSPQPQQ